LLKKIRLISFAFIRNSCGLGLANSFNC